MKEAETLMAETLMAEAPLDTWLSCDYLTVATTLPSGSYT
jgi:hypothetical protein